MLTKEMIDGLMEVAMNLAMLREQQRDAMGSRELDYYDMKTGNAESIMDAIYAMIIAELESMQQLIEKMKCCGNCAGQWECETPLAAPPGEHDWSDKCDNWETNDVDE